MRCLEKDRAQRYETANGLAADVLRYLSDEPITAGPASAAYRFQKFVRRHKAGVAASAAMVVLLVAGVIGTSIGLLREARQRRIAEQQRTLAEKQRALAQKQEQE